MPAPWKVRDRHEASDDAKGGFQSFAALSTKEQDALGADIAKVPPNHPRVILQSKDELASCLHIFWLSKAISFRGFTHFLQASIGMYSGAMGLKRSLDMGVLHSQACGENAWVIRADND